MAERERTSTEHPGRARRRAASVSRAIGSFWHEGEWYVRASTVSSGLRKLVLKDNDAFLVADARGDFPAAGAGEFGFYHRGTRYLSALELRMFGEPPLVLDSDADSHVVVELTNGAPWQLGDRRISANAIFVRRESSIVDDVLYQSILLHNFDLGPVELDLTLIYGADFADIFEVRGSVRPQRGELLEPELSPAHVRLSYAGLDRRTRSTDLRFEPVADEVGDSWARFRIDLGPSESREIHLRVSCELADGDVPGEIRLAGPIIPLTARREKAARGPVPTLLTSHDGLNGILDRATRDVLAMISETEGGPYPYAGIPWYSAPFGRDGSVTALELLPWLPWVARGVLRFQARHQAVDFDDFTDREPGKILHEFREGEMAALREIPFVPYYGTADATPLFLILLREYVAATNDLELLNELWPNALAALEWIERHGDLDGDGLIEYRSRSPVGLRNQGWKDSFDAISHEDGSIAEPPIAVCEVQGYACRAWEACAELAELRGDVAHAIDWRNHARDMRERVHAAYWIPDRGYYALALDADKRPCRVLTTNAGHLLWSGTAPESAGEQLAHRLCEPQMQSGFGLRTLASTARRFNPLSYHNGSVWPHDNALVADGLRRYGHLEGLFDVFTGIVNAVEHTPDLRVPELFCGFQRTQSLKITPYPVACGPQAWSAAAMFQFVRTLLGLTVDARTKTVWLDDPVLPPWLEWIEVRGLPVLGGTLAFVTVRGRLSCSVEILEKPTDVRMYIKK